jgi:hypothetical protein
MAPTSETLSHRSKVPLTNQHARACNRTSRTFIIVALLRITSRPSRAFTLTALRTTLRTTLLVSSLSLAGCANGDQKSPLALSAGPTSTEVITALTEPLSEATRISLRLSRNEELTATRDPDGVISIESSIPPSKASGIFVDHPLGSFSIRDSRALWREPDLLALHSLSKDAWIEIPLSALALDRGHLDIWASASRLAADLVLKDVELSTLLLVEIEDISITDTTVTASIEPTEEFHFTNDTHRVSATVDALMRLVQLTVTTDASASTLSAAYEPQPRAPTLANVLEPTLAAPVVDEITTPARLANLNRTALRLDAVIRSAAPSQSSRSTKSLKAALKAQDFLGSTEVELASVHGAVSVWSTGRLDELALDIAAPDPTFIQLRQRNVTVCLRLSATGNTFTFISPDEDLSTPRPGALSRAALERDPDGSVISATSVSSTPACHLVTPFSREASW